MIALSARGSGSFRIVGNLVVYSVLKPLSKPVGVRTVLRWTRSVGSYALLVKATQIGPKMNIRDAD